jgi:hypothetical protein
MSQVCRSCGEAIEFGVWNDTHGKRVPLDLGEFDYGNVEVIGRHGLAPIVRLVPQGERDRPLRRTHFVSCPDASRWRRRR